MTPDEELASCERSDRAFNALLGRTLSTATLRLVAIVLAVCAAFAAASEFA